MQSAFKTDPSKTATLRAAFERELRKGFRLVEAAVILFLYADDELGLDQRFGLRMNARKYSGIDDDRKVEAFRNFFAEAVRREILERLDQNVATPRAALYVMASFRAAGGRTYREVRKELLSDLDIFPQTQTAFVRGMLNDPDVQAHVKLLVKKANEEFKAVAKVMESRAVAALSDALANGLSAKKAGAAVAAAVSDAGRLKARMAAHRAVVSAAAEGQLDAYARLGNDEVELTAEWITLKGACPRCLDMAASGPYLISEIHGLIPLHNWCRCSWRVVAPDKPKRRKR